MKIHPLALTTAFAAGILISSAAFSQSTIAADPVNRGVHKVEGGLGIAPDVSTVNGRPKNDSNMSGRRGETGDRNDTIPEGRVMLNYDPQGNGAGVQETGNTSTSGGNYGNSGAD